MNKPLQLKEGEAPEPDPATGKWKAVPEIPNRDSRRMQPLPWEECYREPGKCLDIKSQHTGKQIMSFWGSDKRHPKNLEWCTEAQILAHGKYALHCCNRFPDVLREIERIYWMEDMPEKAVKAIEALMERVYLQPEEVPHYAK